MGQNLAVPKEFNSSRQVLSFPSWFITNHDLTPSDVRNAMSFLSFYHLESPDSYELVKGNPELNKQTLFLYLYHRVGVTCPELIRINIEVDELDTISFRDYDERGIIIGESIFTLVINTIPSTLAKATSRLELHSQSCRLTSYLNDNDITSEVFLELIDVVLSAVILFTNIEPTHTGVESVLKMYSSLYEIYFEINLISQSECNHTLVDVAYNYGQPIVEWLPSVLSAGYQYTDQLVLWLITIINALSHIVNGNQLQYNVTDMVMIAFDYATLGLQQEEKLFISNYQYEHREKHLKQHLELAQKIKALKDQIPSEDSLIIIRRLLNILNEWLSVHILVNDKYMVSKCVPQELLRKQDSKRAKTQTDAILYEAPNCLAYVKKYQIGGTHCAQQNSCC